MAGVTLPSSNLDALYALPVASLRALAASLTGGPLSVGITAFALQPIAGTAASQVLTGLECLLATGMTLVQLAVLIEVLAGQKARFDESAMSCSLVLSGPDISGVPTADTGAVMQTLIAEARRHVLLVGYAIHNGQRLFEPLAQRMSADPELAVTLCIDIGRGYQDTTRADDLVRRFADDFRAKHWPWPNLPKVYYDPRALAPAGSERASLHAKCVIVDRRAALITSANFTEAAQQRNIEAGVLVRRSPLVEQLAAYFDGLLSSGQLVGCPLLP